MKIGIDLKPFSTGSKYRGIGMYSRELIKELLKLENDAEYHFLNMYTPYHNDPEMDEKCYLHEYYMGPKIVDVGEKQLFRDESLDNMTEAYVRHFLKKSEIEVMLFTSPNEYGTLYKAEWFKDVFTVGILYDLIPLIFPDQCLFDRKYKADYERSLKFIKNLDLLLAISESAKNDAVKLLGIPPEKIAVIYAGIDPDFRKLPKVKVNDLKAKYQIADPFILFAGGIDFKKNIEGVIRAFSKIEKALLKKYQLVIVGKTAQDVIDKFYHIANECGIREKVICTGFVPKEDLIGLYNIADLFVFPSLYEGFGLPVIEAMACGTRVLTSDCSSLAEIAKDYAVLINPKREKSITKGIMQILNHPLESIELAEKAISYAQSYTWKKVAETAYQAITQKFILPNCDIEASPFLIDDTLLKNIAALFAYHGVELTDSIKEDLIEQLLTVSEGKSLDIKNGKYRIIYDVTVVREWLKSDYQTGIGRVCNELYKELKKKVNLVPVAIETHKKQSIYKLVDMYTYEIMDTIITLKENDIFFMPEFQVRGVQVPTNHPYANELRKIGIKCYAILYDILPLQFPQYFEKKTAAGFKEYLLELLENYDGILSDSCAVSDEIIKYYQENLIGRFQHDIKIGYFHLGQNSFQDNSTGIVRTQIKNFFEDAEQVYFMLGTIEPRKGHELVLKAFEELWDDGKDECLCIMGHMGWNMQQFVKHLKNHPQFGKRLLFIEAASDAEVKYAYQHAAALIQASAGEGFGLPLIETGSYGLPILCSNIPVFHEVAGNNALYFERNTAGIIKVIEEFQGLLEEEKLPCSSDIETVTWKNAADRVMKMIVEDKEWYKIIRKNDVIEFIK